MKLWAGRFAKEADKRTNDFNSSIKFDSRMYREDIDGSIAHAVMLGTQGIIPVEDCEKIINGLKQIKEDIASGRPRCRRYPYIYRADSHCTHR